MLEYGPAALTLHRAGGSLVAAFSVRGYSREVIRRSAEADRKGWPSYFGPEEYAYSVRRMVATRARQPWERFLRTERRVLQARRRGQMARALTWRLPGEASEVLDRIASEDRRRAEEGLVELRGEEGEFYFKPVEEISPQDRMDRLRADLVRIEWLLERHERCALISRSDFFGTHQSRKSFG